MASLNSSDMYPITENNLSIGIIVYITCIGIVLTFAVCSNMLVIYCVIRIRNLRTITNIFICNLSISDVLFATYVMPMKLHDISHYNLDWYEGVIHCKLTNSTPIMVISSSIYILVAISFERRQVMHGRGQGQDSFTWKKLMVVIVFIWAFSIGIASPTMFEYAVHDVEISDGAGNQTRTLKSCGSVISRELALANAIFVFIISYIIPVILMTKNYSQIAMFVWRKGKWIKKHLGSTTGSRLFKHRTRIVKLLVIVAAIFAVTWFPFFVILIYAVLYVLCFTRPRYQVSVYRTIGPLVMIYFQKSTGNDASENAAGFSNLLLLALAAFSTAYNVVLYVIFNPSFKQAIIGVLRCNSVREVNDRVIDEPSQASATMRETETGTTFVIQDGKRHFHNRITPVEVTGDG